MPIDFEIDQDGGVVISTCLGILTGCDLTGLQKQLVQEKIFNPKFSHLVDLRRVTELDMTTEEVVRFAENTVFDDDSRIGLVAENDLLFGMGRLYASNRDPGAGTLRVFRDVGGALAWLGESPASG